MNDNPDIVTVCVVIGAFIVGYGIVSVLVSRFMSRTTGPSKAADSKSNDSSRSAREDWEARRRQQEEEARQREAERRQAERERIREEDQRRKQQEDARSGSAPHADTTVKDEKYYGRILGLRGHVTPDDVRKRYRILVTQYHPDKVNHLGPKLKELAENEMKELNEAFEYFKRKYG